MKLAVVLLFSSLAVAQQSVTTSGPCSPVAPENTGTITINCPGMSKDQGQKMLAILNKILANQIDPDVVMAKLGEIEKEIQRLDPAAPVITYFYDGTDRISRPGLITDSGSDIPTHKAFERIQEANSKKDWQSLNSICDEAIKQTPKWLTPYLFKGVAYANIGKMSEAVVLLEDVRKKAEGNMDYGPLTKHADELLKKLHEMGY
jgi:hypothetical protein